MHVICTAGHVDHGKSSLVRALTGMEPDRFAEERERGLTIDLGFAWTTLGDRADAPTVAFVDLPGHERFITNMLAGAGPVELALFVVAADEGWMPQSQEHLEILDLLGVRHAVIALSKADLVDTETLELSAALVAEELAGSSLAGASVVGVSATTGAGMDALRRALAELVAAAPAARDRGRPRLWIDRSFSARGSGTVVTGTLGDGAVRIGDSLAVLPEGTAGRVRALQSLKRDVDHALPGSRVAVNLSGVDRAAVERGDALGRPDQWLAASALEAWVRVLPGQGVDRKGAWHLHVGSADRTAAVYPVRAGTLTGEGGVRIELDRPVTIAAGDRVVLRDAGRRATVAGGEVLDADPGPRARGREGRAAREAALRARRAALAAGDRAALLALHLDQHGAAPAARAAAAVGLDPAELEEVAQQAGVVVLGDTWVAPSAFSSWAHAVHGRLADYHRDHPVERVAPKDVAVRAAEAAGCPGALVAAFLDAQVRRGQLVAEGPGLRTADHRVALDDAQTQARRRLLGLLSAEPYSPPRLSSAAEQAGAAAALVRELEAAGDIVRVSDDLAFTSTAVAQATERLREAFAAEGPLTAARAKEILATSRKYALPLLEHLDRTGRTRREGDRRIVR